MAKKTRTVKATGTRGTLTSMKVTPGFVAFAVEQLQKVKGLRTKAMFGGVGLYAADVFFGLLARDRLFLMVDDSNRGQYEAAGMKPFKPYADKPMVMPYFQVPVAILEDAGELVIWARRSMRVATKSVTRKARGRPNPDKRRGAAPR